MSQAHVQSYEVALFGEFFARDLSAILSRITLHSESSETLHSREVVFEPVNRGEGDPILLRARKDLMDPNAGWTLYSYLAPESVRAHPEATVRPWATVHVQGDALSFACALGYVRRSQLYKRGYLFRRGMLVIQMFQQETMDSKTQEPIPANVDTLWEVEVKTAFPMQNTQETPLRHAIDAVLDVQMLMKAPFSDDPSVLECLASCTSFLHPGASNTSTRLQASLQLPHYELTARLIPLLNTDSSRSYMYLVIKLSKSCNLAHSTLNLISKKEAMTFAFTTLFDSERSPDLISSLA